MSETQGLARTSLKIFCYTDLTITPANLFWHRDLGLLTKAFRKLGHDAWLVVHPALEFPSKIKHQKSKTQKGPVIWASPYDVRSPSWWQNLKPDLVIFGLWTRPKYDSVRLAALSATPHIIERADSDGMRTASCGLKEYARRRYDYARDRTFVWPALFSIPASLFYALSSVLATPWIEARLRKTLRLLPALTVETPQAANRWKKLATKLRAKPSRVFCVPHPVQTEIFRSETSKPKNNQIISVGRWESYQKNLPLLLKTLLSFLDRYPDWNALVIGSNLPQNSPHPRLFFSAPLSPVALAEKMRESKIFFSSSRYESFGLAAAEALASGCQIVAPSGVLDHLVFRPPGDYQRSLASSLAFAAQAPSAGLFHADAEAYSFTPTEVAKRILSLRP